MLIGEDAAAYETLHARICAALPPRDIIDEMYIDDVVSSQWKVLRWRALSLSLLQAPLRSRLNEFVQGNLPYDLYSKDFADDLTEALQDNLPEDQQDFARSLAQRCARNEPDAVEKVEEILPSPPEDELQLDPAPHAWWSLPTDEEARQCPGDGILIADGGNGPSGAMRARSPAACSVDLQGD